MEAKSCRLFVHPLFEAQLDRLISQVEIMAAGEPKHYLARPAAKLLKTIRRYMLETIPRDPAAPEFRLGNALGPDNRHWFRAKFHQRYRLFYRFSSQQKIIIYTWVNDEFSLRKAGAKTHPYAIFQAMLKRGELPNAFEDLLRQSRRLRSSERE
jgi:toxin YhaV